MKVVVVGAVNMDICGRPYEPLVMRDSNPGTVTMTPGGVGRNIAHDLRLLGLDVTFITAMGDDAYAQSVLKSCLELGFDMSLARRIPGGRTSTYMYITDSSGEMELAVSDTDVADTLTPEYLAGCMDGMNSADAVVIDGNLTARATEYIGKNCTVPLYADPVSAAKAGRLKSVLPYLTAFKPNEIEAMHLTNTNNAEDAARALVDAGVGRAFVSLGANGIIAAEGNDVVRLPCEQAVMVNTTGAGDAATAAIVWAGVHGLSLEESARAAMKAGALAISCRETNNPALCAQAIQ